MALVDANGDQASSPERRDDEAAGSLGDKAKSIAERQMTAGVEVIDSVGRVMQKVGKDLESEVPVVAPYVSQAAESIQDASSKLRDRSIGEIVESISDFGRKQPATFIAGAVMVGLLLSRFVKSGASSTPESDTTDKGSAHHG